MTKPTDLPPLTNGHALRPLPATEAFLAKHGTLEVFRPRPQPRPVADRCKPFTADTFQHEVFPPVRWAVENILPEGATIFAGKPKMGKSFMMLNIAAAIACGGVAFSKIACEPGDVLMCALEDPRRRIHSRLKQLLADRPWPRRLQIVTEMPRLDEGGLDMLRRFLDEAANPALICIDTFAKVRPPVSGRNTLYAEDYDAIAPLQMMAGEYGVSIVMIHHLRKTTAEDPFDEVSGTTGLTGCADTTLHFKREPGRADAILYGRGRDLEEFEKAFSFDKERGLWTLLGEAEAYKNSEDQAALLDALKNASEPMTVSDLCAAVDRPHTESDTIKKTLYRMEKAELVKRAGRGKFVAV